jgi:hypothetical protein
MRLDTDLIRIDGDTQPRAELDSRLIKEYAELMRAGAAFPAVSVFYDGQNYWLADGFHRFHAWCRVRAGQPIKADVFQGSLEDARWHSYGVNLAHGLRRTNADKERAVRRALEHPKALLLSNRRIAEHCGVTGNTVARYRRELESAVSLSPIGELSNHLLNTAHARLRMGRDGRIINTARIGSVQQRKDQTSPCMPVGSAADERASVTGSVRVELSKDDPRRCAHELMASFPFEFLEKVFLNVFSLHRRHQSEETAS